MKLTSLLQLVDKLHEAGKVDAGRPGGVPSNLVPRVLLGTKVPWWITWFRFIAQILGNKIINFEGGNIIY